MLPAAPLRVSLFAPVAALALGAAAYLLRPGEVIAFGWARAMGLGRAIDGLRHAAAPVRGHVPPAVLDVLPDAAWALALAGIVRFSWALAPGRARRVWLAAGFALAIGWELAQGLHLVRGTFDPRDLLVSAIAYALAASMPFSQSAETIERTP